MNRRNPLPCLLAVAAAFVVAPAMAQVASRPVGEGSGPVSEISRGIKRDSGPVFGDGGPVRGLSVESGSVGSVGGSVTGTVRSGAIKDITVGSVRTQLPPGFYAGAQRDAAAEMQIDDRDESDFSLVAEPVPDLGPLAEVMRAIRPLPEYEPDDTGGAEGDLAQADEADGGEVEVPGVENPDEVDPTQVDRPAVPDTAGPAGVFMPAPPKVGAPSEVVPIPMPGSTPQPDYD
ncbi:hypothetical protein L6Q96_05055 [Candidatus Binatia bacterium]|nr:hypothetical protein [Candidatus Binatia bacterium]